MKNFVLSIAIAIVAIGASDAFAQCYGGFCRGGSCYGTYAAPSYYGSCYGGSCYRSAARVGSLVVGEYRPIESTAGARVASACEPCAATIQIESDAFDAATACPCGDCPCDPCQCAETVEACEPVETVETTEPVPACGQVATQATATICVNGTCARRPVASAVKTTVAASYLAAANAVRALRGLRPLALDQSLDVGSYNHAVSMSHYGALYHASGVREIVALNGETGVAGALQQWTDSPRHAALLFNPSYTRAGIAAYRDANGRNWCVMRFN